MAALGALTRPADVRDDAGLDELRGDALRGSILIVVGFAFAVLLFNGVSIASLGERPAYLAIALAAVAAICHGLVHRSVRAGAMSLVCGLLCVAALADALYPGFPAAAVLTVPVLLATVLLGARFGAGTAAAGTLVVAVAAIARGGLAPNAAIELAVLWALLACAIVLWRGFYVVLDWSWMSYADAQRRTDELRERQGELAGLNRGLNQAYDRLEQITAQLERARQAAEEARRLKTEFAASVSHELRTPVNLVIGLSELMVTEPHGAGPRLPDVYRADAEAIYRNACHVSNLIDDVLDLSQIEAHRMGIVREWTAISHVVEQACATVRTLFDNTGLSLSVLLPNSLPEVFVDPVRVRQILINLLNNAVRFTDEGSITISARVEAEQLALDITDTGSGIAPEDLAGVFHEFWRSGQPVRGRRGSGLGLAVSQRFAELHGGNLSVASTVGCGSTFTLSLPLGEKAVIQDAELGVPIWQRIEQRAPEHPRVLLVDPEPEALRVFSRYLDGYEVAVVPDGPAAVAAAKESPVRAFLVGSAARRDTLRRALHTAELAEIAPIVTCRLRTARTIAQELGVLDYLVKPVEQHDLRRALRRLPRVPRDLLIVDDDPEMLHVLGRMVGALLPRCRIRSATNGVEALTSVRDHPPDAVFVDLLMPELDGYELIEKLPGVPKVVITARGAEDDGLVADMFDVSRGGGMQIGELTRWIRGGLDAQRLAIAPPQRAPEAPTALPAWRAAR